MKTELYRSNAQVQKSVRKMVDTANRDFLLRSFIDNSFAHLELTP